MDGGAWWAAVHGVAGSQTRLSDWFKGRRPLTSFWNFLVKQVCSQPSRQRPDDSHNVLLVPSPWEGARGKPGAPSQAPEEADWPRDERAPEGDAGEAGTRPARGRCHLPGGGAPAEPG